MIKKLKSCLISVVLGLACGVSFAIPIKESGNSYSEVKDANVITITSSDNIVHADKTCETKKSIDITAKTMTIKDSTYISPIITLIASSVISLSKSSFKGVLSLEGATLIIKDCIIKSLVISNYDGKLHVKLQGKTKIEEGVQFLGNPGSLEIESDVAISGKVTNGNIKKV